jgi:hypothetical protein
MRTSAFLSRAQCTLRRVRILRRAFLVRFFSPAMDVDDANGALPTPSSSHTSLAPSLGTSVTLLCMGRAALNDLRT